MQRASGSANGRCRTIRLRNVLSPGRQGPVRSPVDPVVQIREVSLKICLVIPPRQPVHAWRGIALEREERFPEQIDAEVVEERGEPFLLPVPCGCPYAIQRQRFPGSAPGTCFACPRFPRSPPLAPPPPRPVARSCSSASQLLWRGLTSRDRSSSATAPRLPDAGRPDSFLPPVGREISRFPVKERPYMPGSWTSPDRPGARANAPVRVAFRGGKRVGVRGYQGHAVLR